MRVISGFLKGRKFNPPANNWPTRPTTDFSREGLFNILQNELNFNEVKALDLFGGTGSHSFELISRGCKEVTFVDKHRPCVKFVEKTAEEFGVSEYIKLLAMDAAVFIKSAASDRYDYIFSGPPYPLPWLDTIPDRIFENQLLLPSGLLVLEHNPKHDFSEHPYFRELRTYGTTHFSFFHFLKKSDHEPEIY